MTICAQGVSLAGVDLLRNNRQQLVSEIFSESLVAHRGEMAVISVDVARHASKDVRQIEKQPARAFRSPPRILCHDRPRSILELDVVFLPLRIQLLIDFSL